MTKTNHARGFKDIKFTMGQRSHHAYYKCVKEETLSGDIIIACGTTFSENAKGIRRSRAGAKKFVHSRRRRADRDFLNAGDFDE
jgi:L-ribulose-5-phosphate 3-epimerase UlaE